MDKGVKHLELPRDYSNVELTLKFNLLVTKTNDLDRNIIELANKQAKCFERLDARLDKFEDNLDKRVDDLEKHNLIEEAEGKFALSNILDKQAYEVAAEFIKYAIIFAILYVATHIKF